MTQDRSWQNGNQGMRKKWINSLVTNWLVTDPELVAEYSNEKEKQKNYQAQRHDDMIYIYFLGGRLKTLKKVPINLLTGLLVLVPGILFWVFEAKWHWHNTNPSLTIIFTYLWLLTFSFYFKCSTSDPGLLPRNVHYPFDVQEKLNLKPNAAPSEYLSVITLPHQSSKHEGVATRYCTTCHVWRPPRTSHCSTCNSCILHHDHHCGFLNNCLGQRNYKHFLWFLAASVLSCLFLAIISFLHVFNYRMTETPTRSFKSSISKYPVSFLLAIFALIALVYPSLLFAFHLFLTANNLTTREYLSYVRTSKNTDSHYVNVFNQKLVLKNLYISWLGMSPGISLLDLRKSYVADDIRFKRLEPMRSFVRLESYS